MRGLLKCAASLLGALLACATPSHAASYAQNAGFDYTHALFGTAIFNGDVSYVSRDETKDNLLRFTGFDTSLGTLTGVRITMSSTQDITTRLTFVGDGIHPAGGTAWMNDAYFGTSVNLGGQTVGSPGGETLFDTTDLYCSSFDGPSCPIEATFHKDYDIDVAAIDLAPFMAGPFVDFDLQSDIDYSAHAVVGATELFQSLGRQDWHGNVSLQYSYEPAAAVPSDVPEPAAWALMLGGFALVGGMLRMRRNAVRFA